MSPLAYGLHGLHGLHGGHGGRGFVRLLIHLAIWRAIWRHPLIGWPLVAIVVAVIVITIIRNRRPG